MRQIFYFLAASFLAFSLGFSFDLPAAKAATGTIDAVYKYAWGENIGWINFGESSGNVLVTDEALTGYAWTENYGWINLAPPASGVLNDGQGNLSGSAWGEQTGYVDFSGVTIDSEGYFHGYGEGDVTGQISFNCDNSDSCGTADFKTRTSWRGAAASPAPSSDGGGSSGGRRYLKIVPILPRATEAAALPASACLRYGHQGVLVRKGSHGEPARGVQRAINEINILDIPLSVDGVIGSKSHIGIQMSQKILGIKVDGLWGAITEETYANWVAKGCPSLR